MSYRNIGTTTLWLPILVAAGTIVESACSGSGDAGRPAPQPTATASPAAAPAGDIPYRLELEAFSIDGLPGLQSFESAGDAGKLVLLAGRTNGMHGFAPNRTAPTHPSFPRTQANDTVYVLDLAGRKLLGKAPVSGLPAMVANQLKASNGESLVQGNWLFLVGGYGPFGANGTLATLPYVTAIDMTALTAAVVAGTPLDSKFAAANTAVFQHPALAISGGGLDTLANLQLLMFGQLFSGEYVPGGGPAQQQYSNSVRIFQMSASRDTTGKVNLQVTFQGQQPASADQSPESQLHRRDLTFLPAIGPAGTERIAAYGGVFKGGRMEGYLNPVYVDPASGASVTVQPDTTVAQLLSQYDCAAIPIYDAAAKTMYSTFFGGISQFHWDDASHSLQKDALDLNHGVDGLPFINSISTLKVPAAGGAAQYVHLGQAFPPAGSEPKCADGKSGQATAAFLGAETRFVPAGAAARFPSGVLKLNEIHQKTLIGYMVGGIAATQPYGAQGPTCASGVVYQVTLDPTQATTSAKLQAP